MKKFLICCEGANEKSVKLREIRILENEKVVIYRGEKALRIAKLLDSWLGEWGEDEKIKKTKGEGQCKH